MNPLSPKATAAFHLTQVILWLAMIPVTLLTGLKTSVTYLIVISILSLVFSEAAAWQASMVERRLDSTDSYGDE